ncbi:hypothetical protein [Achromobacter xylosoxidans]|uniref:hypothetical protein n=1 Tax=Alcaligenes xylosoxydans xylosoxydans TaxID=85698 RepID=UPI0038FC919B
MTSQPQRFLDHLAAQGWILRRTTSEPTPAVAPPGDRHGYGAFLATFTELQNADRTRWFLSAADHDGTADSALPGTRCATSVRRPRWTRPAGRRSWTSGSGTR